MTPFGPTDGVRNACMRHGNCRIPGGSSANVIKGLANLAPHRITATFLGMVGRDATGREYRQRLEEQGVVPVLLVGSRISLSVCLDLPSSPFLLVYPTPPCFLFHDLHSSPPRRPRATRPRPVPCAS